MDKYSINNKWVEFDPDPLIKLLKKQWPKEKKAIDALKKCKKGWWRSPAYLSFTTDILENRTEKNILLLDENKKTIALDYLKNGLIGGIEFFDRLHLLKLPSWWLDMAETPNNPEWQPFEAAAILPLIGTQVMAQSLQECTQGYWRTPTYFCFSEHTLDYIQRHFGVYKKFIERNGKCLAIDRFRDGTIIGIQYLNNEHISL